jgi:Carboxypeptidase regulatory-like domain
MYSIHRSEFSRVKSCSVPAALQAVMFSALLIVFLLQPAFAQEFRGTISGKIADATGAVIANAKITVTETGTGTVNRTQSDSSGQYVVPFLLPGTYRIEAQAPGFEAEVQNSVTLQAQEHPIIDFTLPIGNTNETVTVTNSTPLLDQSRRISRTSDLNQIGRRSTAQRSNAGSVD